MTTLSSIFPRFARVGQQPSITFTGTGFTSPATVNAPAGVTVANVNVVSATEITCTFEIVYNAPTGDHWVSVTSGGVTTPAVPFGVYPVSSVPNNLGYKVTTRNWDWNQYVRERWGDKWDIPYGIYFMDDEKEIVYVIYNSAITPAPSAPPLPVVGPGAPTLVSGCGLITTLPTITWEASVPGTYPVANYLVYRSTSSSSGFSVLGQVNSLSYMDFTAAQNTEYYYYAVAVDAEGNTSSPSATQSCTPHGATPWSLVFTDSGTGNSNGSAYQTIVSDTAGTYAMAVGGPGTVSSSDGGNTWARNNSFPGLFNLPAGLKFNGTYFVAFDEGTTEIYFSTDLNTWTTNSVDYQIYNIVQDAGSGAIYLSPYATSSTDVFLYRIAPNSNTITTVINGASGPNLPFYGNPILTGGGVTVSGFGGYPTYIPWYSTNNGLTWTVSPTNIAQDFFGLAYNGSKWLIVTGEFTSPYATVCWTSTDGISWTNVYSTTNPVPAQTEVTAFNGLFLSFANQTIGSSPDGVTWTMTNLPIYLEGITVSSTRAYAYGYDGIYESTDGLNWTATSVTVAVNDVQSSGLILAAAGEGMPAYIYKRTKP